MLRQLRPGGRIGWENRGRPETGKKVVDRGALKAHRQSQSIARKSTACANYSIELAQAIVSTNGEMTRIALDYV